MPKLYYPTPDEVRGDTPLNEQLWFPQMQSLLVSLANTNEGRDLLCIDPWRKRPYPIVAMGKNYVRYYLGQQDGKNYWLTDFRIGAKWGNVIRSRWQHVRKGLDRMNLEALLSLPQLLVLADGTKLLVPAGGTTTTFYPDPHVETTTVDGSATFNQDATAWATLRGGNGSTSNDSGTTVWCTQSSSATTNTWKNMDRDFYLFDTSSIGSDSVDSGTFELVLAALEDSFSGSKSLVDVTIASNTAVANSDYQGTVNNTTKQATDVALSAMTADSSTYNAWTLNAIGKSSVNTSGVTKFGLRETSENDNSEPGWISGVSSYIQALAADTAGTATDPKLVIVHSVPFTNLTGVGQYGGTQPAQIPTSVVPY